MISNWQKIAFIEVELQTYLKMNTPGWTKQFKEWYEKAVDLLEDYKHYLINKESDEQDYREAIWDTSMD